MFRRIRFECGACGEGFVDWHDDEWQRAPVFCVHCGAAIVAGAATSRPASPSETPMPHAAERSGRALGVLKASGEGFRDTLPGLTADRGEASPEASDSTRDTEPPQARPPGQSSSRARSTAPKSGKPSPIAWLGPPRRLAPLAALLLGFAAGIPAALLAENPLLRFMNPAAHAEAELGREFAAVSAAIDERDWQRARQLLARCATRAPAGDRRFSTLRARLTLGLILANRPDEAGRELLAVQNLPAGRSTAADLRRVYDALFPVKSSAAPSPPVPVPSAAPPRAKVVVTRRELLSFARDRQRGAQLDAAERLYAEVLRAHPSDAEARCGLAEVQLLRGGTDDSAKLFQRALSDNPSYSPAWVGLGDVDWLRGHAERAACRYRAVIERFPASSYPPYIARRVEQVANSGVSPPQARSDVDAASACGD